MCTRSAWCSMNCWWARCRWISANWLSTRSCGGCGRRMRRVPARSCARSASSRGITAQNRGADPPTLARQLRGDLDAIALKALEKDRSRRYATPSELAADIGRYLRHEPVLARPASAGYRAAQVHSPPSDWRRGGRRAAGRTADLVRRGPDAATAADHAASATGRIASRLS